MSLLVMGGHGALAGAGESLFVPDNIPTLGEARHWAGAAAM